MLDFNRFIMDNSKKALKSGIWYTISNFSLKAIGFLTIPIFTRILSKEEFGLYNNYTSWLSIATVIITLQLASSLISARFDFEDDFDGYILSVMVLNAVLVSFWAVSINIFSVFFVDLTHVDLVYLNAMLTFMAFSSVVEFFQMRERYLFKYKVSCLLSVGLSIITAILSVVLVLDLENKLLGMILGTVIPMVLAGTILAIFFLKKGKHVIIKYWRYALPICLPYVPHVLGGSLLSSMDRVMIERFCGAESTAIYSLAYSCGAMITLLISSLNNAFAPWLGEKMHYRNYEEIRGFSKKYIIVFLSLAIVLMLIAPEILYILGGEPYMEAKYVITPVAMGCVCQFLYTMYVNVEQFNKKTVGMAVATVVAAAVNFGLNYLLIPIYGYLVAAYTTLFGFLILLLIHMFLVRRMGLKDIYDNQFVLLMVLVGIIIMFVITFSYRFDAARYVVSFAYIVFIWILGYRYRKTVKSFFKKKTVG